MTPAINLLKKNRVKHRVHTYDHDPGSKVFGEEAADKLGIPYDRIFKTLVVLVDTRILMCALVPVSKQLDLKTFAKSVSAKKTQMADTKEVERTTGYLVGGVSPLGQKKRLKTVMDESALQFDTIFVSGGKRGLQVELSPRDLISLTRAETYSVSR